MLDERLDAVSFDSLREGFVILHAGRASNGVFEARARADQQSGGEAFGMRCAQSQRHTAAHRVAEEMGARNAEGIEGGDDLRDATLHAVVRDFPGRLAASVPHEVDANRAMRASQTVC